MRIDILAAEVKILMTWDIQTGNEEDYFEFVVREYLPGMQKLGLPLSDAWLTMYGQRPRVMAEAKMPNLLDLQKVLRNPDWEELTDKLLEYVKNFNYKVVHATPGFQM